MLIKRLAVIFEKYQWILWIVLAVLLVVLGVLGLNLFGRDFQEYLTYNERTWLQEHSTLRFAPDPSFKPIEYFDEAGDYQGIMADYFTIIEDRLKLDIEIVQYGTWQEVLDAAKNREIDGITAAQVTQERLDYLSFTSPILDIPNVIITRKDFLQTIRLEDMEGWTVAVTRGYAAEEFLRVNYPYITIQTVDNDLQALQDVAFERADATIVNMAIASTLLQESGITNLRIAGDSGKSNSLSIGVRSDEPTLLAIMEKGLTVLSSQEKDDIYHKWIGLSGGNFYDSSSFWFVIFWALVAVTLILGVALAWNSTLRLQVDSKTAELNQELSIKKTTEVKLSQQLENLSALRAVGSAINTSMDLPLTLNILLDQISSKLNVDACRILLLNPYSRTLDHMADRGFRTPYLRGVDYPIGGTSYAWNAIRTRKLVTEDLTNHLVNPIESVVLDAEAFVKYIGAPLISKGSVKGVLEIYSRTSEPKDQVWMDFLEAMTGQAAIALDNATLFQDLQRANLDLTLAYDATIEGWARALELRDGATEGHSQRVMTMTLDLANRMGMLDEELIHVRRGALLHDIGKMGIPDHILLKPGPLTPEEWEIMRKHPVYAYEMLRSINYLNQALDIPHFHHEKFDGTGYPTGLKGDRIPLSARVFCVVDVWDALTSDRPYRKAWSEDKVIAYIKENTGSHFDPAIAAEFLSLLKIQ